MTGAIGLIAPVLFPLSVERILSSQEPFAAVFGKTIVVTGASDGIGRVAAQTLAAVGAHVIMVGRNEAKTVAAAQRIMSTTGSRTVTTAIADLSRLEAVQDLAEKLQTRHPHIDVLINNAGSLFLDYQLTADGFERTFALNHLAYFALSLRLLPALAAAQTARVINVSSRAHVNARLNVHDVQSPKSYRGWPAYGTSKLANILFTTAFARRLNPQRVAVHALHPGLVSTRFAANNGRRGRLLRRLMDLTSITPEQGADTMLWLAAVDPTTLGSGHYFVRRQGVTPSRAARDATLAESLWTLSEQCTGLNAHALITDAGVGRTA